MALRDDDPKWPNRTRDMDRRLAQIGEAPGGRLECFRYSSSLLAKRLDNALIKELGLVEIVKSPKGRKAWYVLTPDGQTALPHARDRLRARERANRKAERQRQLDEWRGYCLGKAGPALLDLARLIAGHQVPGDAADDMPLNEPLTAGMVRAARAAVQVADEPPTPEE